MQAVFRLIERVRNQTFPVLVLGESGTGKELVARAIHNSAGQGSRTFTPIDCAAIPAALIESELFGYVKGAYTGATSDHPGLLLTARGGTVFLDEIGEIPFAMQAKLLRALQEKEVRPVGSNRRLPFDARIIAATNRDLRADVALKRFRQDLYYRLDVVSIELPPLRERRDDIPLFAHEFLARIQSPDRPRSIREDVMKCLIAYDWPGNVRELENVIQHALALSSNSELTVDDLPVGIRETPQKDEVCDRLTPTLKVMERRTILKVLAECDGRVLEAAGRLGIGKTTLYRKVKEYRTQAALENSAASAASAPGSRDTKHD